MGDVMIKKLGIVCAVATLLAAPAAAVTVTFENTDYGYHDQGFAPPGEPGIFFTAGAGNGLYIGNIYAGQGRSLAAFIGSSYIIGTFTDLQSTMSLTFGNKQTGISPGDLATLTLFNGLTQVGLTTVALNGTSAMDQSISYSGATFDRFTFAYTDSVGNLRDAEETIDNLDSAAPPAPEPASWAMMIGGFGVIGGALRRRRETAVRFG